MISFHVHISSFNPIDMESRKHHISQYQSNNARMGCGLSGTVRRLLTEAEVMAPID